LIYGKAQIWPAGYKFINSCVPYPGGFASAFPCSTHSSCQDVLGDCTYGAKCVCTTGYSGAGVGPGGCYGAYKAAAEKGMHDNHMHPAGMMHVLMYCCCFALVGLMKLCCNVIF
jgi:hypothetical protein